MLRITKVQHSEPLGTVIVLEGKLLAPWVVEVRTACRTAGPQCSPRLDLSAVTYVDAECMQLLEELAASGTKLVNPSPFVAALLKREARS